MYWDVLPQSGFNFDNTLRNEHLLSKNIKMRTTKTGTTIVGVTYKDGVVLGADTRATSGTTVADPNCDKIHYLAPNIYCCGAGTAADCEFVTQMVSSELELARLNNRVESRVSQVESRLSDHLFKYGGNIGAHLICAGVDVTGPHLVNLSFININDR